jgi:hypothetical protein
MKRWILLALVLALVAVACGDNQTLVPPGAQTTVAVSVTTDGLEPTTTQGETTLPTGGGPLTGDEQALADAIGAAAAAEMGGMGDEFPIDANQFSSCMGTAVVGALGVARLNELGVTAADVSNLDAAFEALTPAEQQAVLTAMIPCVDTPEIRDALVQEISAMGLSVESSECIVDAFLDPALLNELVGLVLSGEEELDLESNPELVNMLTTAMLGCLSPEEMADLMGGG